MPAAPTTTLSASRQGTTRGGIRIVLLGAAAITGLVLLAHLGIVLWSSHEFTQVESVVSLHASMLGRGEGLYYNLNEYPFTASPYGPIFYSTVALLHLAGAPLFLAGRLISFLALLASFYFCWRILRLLVSDPLARASGIILIAVTARLGTWGTVAQTDSLAICFSLGAFACLLEYLNRDQEGLLWWAGLLVIAAIFTKQSAISAAVAIGLVLLWRNRKTGLAWSAATGLAVIAIALGLNAATNGGYFANAIRANLNPLSADKFWHQVEQFFYMEGFLVLVVIAGAKGAAQRSWPLYLYTALAGAIFLATAPKVGSDLNYQMEISFLVGLCAACALDALGMFRRCMEGERTWVTLLPMALLLHVVVNVAGAGLNLVGRVTGEIMKRVEVAALAPYLAGERGPVLCTELNALVHHRGRMDVEPLIYTLLVEAGLSDPKPVVRDLAAKNFKTVVLYENVFQPDEVLKTAETPSLPAEHLEQIRRNYRLAKHIPGPYLLGVYVYEPVSP